MSIDFVDAGELKHYLYRSTGKLRELYSQIRPHSGRKWTFQWKIPSLVSHTVEGPAGSVSDHKMLKDVIRELEAASQVGTITEPRDYIKGVLPMRWGIYSEDGIGQDDGPLVYFGGLDNETSTLVGLGGSSKYVVGHEGASGTSSLSYTQKLVAVLLHGLEHGAAPPPLCEVRAAEESLIYSAVAIAQHRIRPPTQGLEFLAKTLMVGKAHGVERYIGIASARVIIGTPLYVALVSQASQADHWGMIPDGCGSSS